MRSAQQSQRLDEARAKLRTYAFVRTDVGYAASSTFGRDATRDVSDTVLLRAVDAGVGYLLEADLCDGPAVLERLIDALAPADPEHALQFADAVIAALRVEVPTT